MTSENLATLLAVRVMGWTVGPDRFLTGERRWLPKWRFKPGQSPNSAFQLLAAAKPEHYTLESEKGGDFWVRVKTAEGVGEARHSSMPQAITLAVARAFGIDPEANG